eukprot:7910559-Pyramimonas_sp.AAC.1
MSRTSCHVSASHVACTANTAPATSLSWQAWANSSCHLMQTGWVRHKVVKDWSLLVVRVPFQRVYPKTSIPALFVFDHTPLEAYLSCLQRACRAAPKAGEDRTDGRQGQGAGGSLKRASYMHRKELSSDSAIPKYIVKTSTART